MTLLGYWVLLNVFHVSNLELIVEDQEYLVFIWTIHMYLYNLSSFENQQSDNVVKIDGDLFFFTDPKVELDVEEPLPPEFMGQLDGSDGFPKYELVEEEIENLYSISHTYDIGNEKLQASTLLKSFDLKNDVSHLKAENDALSGDCKGIIEPSANVGVVGQLGDEPLFTDFEAVVEIPLSYQNPASSNTHINDHVSGSHCSKSDKSDPISDSAWNQQEIETRSQFYCNICNIVFETEKILERHTVMMHKSYELFSCQICGQSFLEKGLLRDHVMKEHIGDGPTPTKQYSCDVCGFGFDIESDLTNHTKIHQRKKSFCCDHCGEEFCTKKNLIQHMENYRHASGYDESSSALTSFIKFEDLSYHTNVRSNGEHSTSNLGSKVPKQNCELKVHRNPHAPSDSSYSCDFYGKSYDSKRDIETHLKRHEAKIPSCNICGKMYAFNSDMSRHMRFHTKEKPFSCNVCFKSFGYKTNLVVHSRIHDSKKPISCDICRRRFANEYDLQAHSSLHVKEDKRFQCHLCLKSLTSRCAMKYHLRVHTREKPFSCKICGKSFSQKRYLNIHLPAHTNPRTFSCDTCGKSYVSSTSLSRHSKFSHHNDVAEEIEPLFMDSRRNGYFQLKELRIHLKRYTHDQLILRVGKLEGRTNLDDSPKMYMDGRFSSRNPTDGNFLKRDRTISAQKQGADECLTCDVCFETFIDSQSMESHRATHSHRKFPKCKVCGRSFINYNSFLNHLCTHTTDKSPAREAHIGHPVQEIVANTCTDNMTEKGHFSRSICDRKFNQENNMTRHTLTHMNAKPFSCEFCSKTFSQIDNLDVHRLFHLDSECFSCKLCGYQSKTKYSLSAHMHKHTGEKPFSCNDCDKRFIYKSTLTRHAYTHTGEKSFSCQICGHKCSQSNNLKVHMRIHTGERPFSCNVCGKGFSQSGSLTIHRRTHTGEKPYLCKVCGARFTQKCSLKKHEYTHTGEEPFSCQVCGDKFISEHLLTVHVGHHTGERPFVSKVSGRKFSFSSNLSALMRIRTEEKPFKCKLCGKRFKSAIGLIGHKRVHSGEKPFLCTICGYKFRCRANLSVHMRKHTGEKPFFCNFCGKRFRHKSTLMNHVYVHSDKKRFFCDVCGHGFNRKGSLATHLRQYPGGKSFPCEVCGKRFHFRSTLTRHLLTHKEAKSFPCEVNHVDRSTGGTHLSNHVSPQRPQEQFCCEYCGERFDLKSCVKRHIIKTHANQEVVDGEQSLKVEICNNVLSAEDAFLECKTTDLGCNEEEDFGRDYATLLMDEKPTLLHIKREISKNENGLERHLKSHAESNSWLVFESESTEKVRLSNHLQAQELASIIGIGATDLCQGAHPDENIGVTDLAPDIASFRDVEEFDIKFELDAVKKIEE
ncbi:hypothetical protein QAD02_018077 [Eretmocerus hayati]|uniref:Uncharacterized protein n=1 Tax=Eretmocerus hayati TaxID=131215 RepID=A0ACC2PFC9_9HYME|nr:hypothetical protein QAD02_018077 [Eretmocerus hayati]